MSSKKKNKQPQPLPEKSELRSVPGSKSMVYLLGLLAMCFVIFSPSLKNDFVNWDDDRNVYENALVRNMDVKEIFSQNVIGNYNPLSILSFAIEHKFFGMDPQMMHLTNIVLHLLCCFLMFKLFVALGLELKLSLLATALFALHPMKVESVSWITERKDVLYGVFFCAALLFYLKQLEKRSLGKEILLLLCFILGLFSKIQMVSLPLTMLAIDYWKDRPMNWTRIWEKSHYFILALIFGLIGISFLNEQGSLETNDSVHTGLTRLFIGSYSFIIYLIKAVVPYELSPLYPYPEELSLWHYLSMPVALLVLFGMYKAYKANNRSLVFGLLFFLVNIVFLLQILGAGQGYLADRFTYIAYAGLVFSAVYAIQNLQKDKPLLSQNLFYAGCAVVMIFSFITYQQTKVWKNSETLWSHVLKYYKNTSLPYNNRANYRRDNKQYERALEDYNNAIKYKAGHATYNSRAKLFFQINQDDKAILDYDKAISLFPKAEYYINRGAAKAKLGRIDESLSDLNKGLELDPSWKTGYLNRSIIYNQRGQYDKAFDDIDRYLKFDPYNADLWYEGARCLRAINNLQKAVDYYSRAIQLKSNLGLFYLERGKTYQLLNQQSLADQDFMKARQLGEKF